MGTQLIVERRAALPVSPAEVFAWHARPGALARLLPPWIRADIVEQGGLRTGARSCLRFHIGPGVVEWTAEHRKVEPPHGFDDVQVSGPFDRWEHHHRFEPGPGGTSLLVDHLACELPFGLGLTRSVVLRQIQRMLAYRERVTAGDLALHAGRPAPPLHVAVTGASGLIGSQLVPLLSSGGHRITRLVRRPPGAGEVQWEPVNGRLDPAALRGIDAVIHLAGENIGSRWTAGRKRAVLESRREGTRVLAEAIARCPEGPRILLSASAVGFYGARGDEELTEASAPGRGFLPDVASAWEAGTAPAEAAGVRVVHLRLGLPLTPAGGVLPRFLLPFRWGLGGRLGNGRQWMSWIGSEDLLGVFHHALSNPAVRGAVNVVAPHPVRNAEFARTLGRLLRRPALLPLPAAALRLVLGQMADETIFASTRVVPRALEQTGYRFRHPTLVEALAHVLGRTL